MTQKEYIEEYFKTDDKALWRIGQLLCHELRIDYYVYVWYSPFATRISLMPKRYTFFPENYEGTGDVNLNVYKHVYKHFKKYYIKLNEDESGRKGRIYVQDRGQRTVETCTKDMS